MLIDYFPHFDLLVVEELWVEVEKDEDDRGLECKCKAPLIRLRIRLCLGVDIIILNGSYNLLYYLSYFK